MIIVIYLHYSQNVCARETARYRFSLVIHVLRKCNSRAVAIGFYKIKVQRFHSSINTPCLIHNDGKLVIHIDISATLAILCLTVSTDFNAREISRTTR